LQALEGTMNAAAAAAYTTHYTSPNIFKTALPTQQKQTEHFCTICNSKTEINFNCQPFT
jgi:hypothetical protein